VNKLPRPTLLKVVTAALLLTCLGNMKAVSDVEPLSTRFARTYSAPTLDIKIEYFSDKPMEELDDFEGFTATLDFTYPLNEVSQIQILLPFYTNGDGDYKKPGDPNDGLSVDVEGYGGVRDFPSIIYERQVPWLEQKLGFNLAWLAGIGHRLDTIDAEDGSELIDKFNHKGDNYHLGLKADADVSDGTITLLGNLHYVFFRDTDDINLTGDDIDFEVLYTKGAIMLNHYNRITPVLEILVEHDFEDFTAVSLSPTVIYSLFDEAEIKLGAPFSVTSDGQDYAVEMEVSYRF
jgi:hypothetical protein